MPVCLLGADLLVWEYLSVEEAELVSALAVGQAGLAYLLAVEQLVLEYLSAVERVKWE
ncbi:MAG: hypothetical protein ACE5I2_00130 [Anaerolineae bacterium]